ncbi:hypothetical protein AMAG_01206 [Allomyces macrogynus ATCC 38327]|uniref:Thioesterase domain-containing protein n=1 Tax=Allomyces macrogynus (strain ATCC 38327) TaxID=578462 RepID=A0A0L0RYZ4_ALLM3|nr:hypothetical protein AMAG_01206 [Allomyces macrogynus ATCC 38327]|eukprot:KNE55299.1 hypothetical protein AMAG_01206 [Allomyces macrogynus ATCC 38327]
MATPATSALPAALRNLTAAAQRLDFLTLYRQCHRVPFLGPTLFSAFIRYAAPYSASACPRVTQFDLGRCHIELEDRWRLRNPFGSVHALALLNIGELASGLALLSRTQQLGRRAIVTKLSASYHKKARGMVFAECLIPPETVAWLELGEPGAVTVKTELTNLQGELLAVCEAEWTVK